VRKHRNRTQEEEGVIAVLVRPVVVVVVVGGAKPCVGLAMEQQATITMTTQSGDPNVPLIF